MTVVFTESCRYELNNGDQNDVNKLFGFGYGWHHTDSDRIGWRYNPKTDKIEIVAYCYSNGKRLPTKPLMEIEIEKEVFLKLEVFIYRKWRSVGFTANNHYIGKGMPTKSTKFKYSLGTYFGGNRRAPHKIIINRIK